MTNLSMAEKTTRFQILNRDAVKYLAVFCMFWGHLFAWLIIMANPDSEETAYSVMPLWMRIVTHFSILCPPMMFFFIADGYKYTRDRKKYAMRLGIFALITQPFTWLVFQKSYGWWQFNVIFTLLLGLLAIMAWESKLKTWQRVTLVILLSGISVLMYADWMLFGVLFILFLHVFREKPTKRLVVYCILTLLWTAMQFIGADISDGGQWLDSILDFCMMMLAYCCMTMFYNGKKGKHPFFAKWFFYVFYPAHHLIIWIVYLLIS